MVNKFDNIVENIITWTLPKFRGNIDYIVSEIQACKKENDFVSYYEKNSNNKMPYDILVEYIKQKS